MIIFVKWNWSALLKVPAHAGFALRSPEACSMYLQATNRALWVVASFVNSIVISVEKSIAVQGLLCVSHNMDIVY